MPAVLVPCAPPLEELQVTRKTLRQYFFPPAFLPRVILQNLCGPSDDKIIATRKFAAARSRLEQLLLRLHLCPFVRIRRRGLALDDRLPLRGELAVLGDELVLRVGHVVLGEDRLDRALGDAQR